MRINWDGDRYEGSARQIVGRLAEEVILGRQKPTEFMASVAWRFTVITGEQLGIDTPEKFLEDLVERGIITVEED